MLIVQLTKFINHKVRIAASSDYYKAPEKRGALEWAYWLQKELKFKGAYYTERSLAMEVLKAERNLFQIIPADRNKSYKSSLENYHKIINHCREILRPKQNLL